MLPEPALTFTLPSLHDNLATPLDCRVYYPQSLSPAPRSPPWRKHVAIMAHPYAPFGGCFDDPVVEMVATMLLRLGYLVGTFNFRGASGSAGRTTWTAKAERADYMSVAGFLYHFAHFLDPFGSASPSAARLDEERKEQREDGGTFNDQTGTSPLKPVFLLGGYSYGAMITAHLPCLATIMAQFAAPEVGSAAAEIRLRAERLAKTQNVVLLSARDAETHGGVRSIRRSLNLRAGGDHGHRKGSHDSRRSYSLDAEDKIKKCVAELKVNPKTRRLQKRRHGVGGGRSNGQGNGQEPGDAEKLVDIPHLPLIPRLTQFRPAYLMVSPLQGLIYHLAAMSFPSAFSRRPRNSGRRISGQAVNAVPDPDKSLQSEAPDIEAEQKLVRHPTLAVYGDQDIFVGARRLREWATRMEAITGSLFRAHEVSTAGHFWTEERVVYIMTDAVKTFAEALLQPG